MTRRSRSLHRAAKARYDAIPNRFTTGWVSTDYSKYDRVVRFIARVTLDGTFITGEQARLDFLQHALFIKQRSENNLEIKTEDGKLDI